ncbi:hypothetical protein GCM10010917_20610 [Paenibacillus physcomitrellae]|uniref:Uncharacterized protein n=1 Tax=Paenibacillus physcomitrellae TaxID=1619311 RepID=A0ABQ1G3L1_9BACL|nr:hypothetical protein GCM10010917_20610 [Paenibacillus physcomitrellae]
MTSKCMTFESVAGLHRAFPSASLDKKYGIVVEYYELMIELSIVSLTCFVKENFQPVSGNR